MEDMSSSEPDDASCFSALMPSGVAPSDDRFAEPALVPEDLLRVLAIRGTRPLSPPRPVPGDPLTPPRCVPRSAESRSTEYRSGRRPPAAPRRDRRGAEEAPANSAFAEPRSRRPPRDRAAGPRRGTAPRPRRRRGVSSRARDLSWRRAPLDALKKVRPPLGSRMTEYPGPGPRRRRDLPGQPDDGISRSRAAAAPLPPPPGAAPRATGRRRAATARRAP